HQGLDTPGRHGVRPVRRQWHRGPGGGPAGPRGDSVRAETRLHGAGLQPRHGRCADVRTGRDGGLMAWIESHQALGHHPKTLRLARELGCNVPCAVGYLHFLWWWALEYATDGLIAADSKPVIARSCMWSGKAERFWAALIVAGFVEPAETPQ